MLYGRRLSNRSERDDDGGDGRLPPRRRAALFYIDVGAILAAAILYCVAGMLGIGMAYHRLLTHRGYKTYKWVEYFLTWCGTLALEGGPIFWVATHRIHHQHSDREGDPHTPREGTWWAHMGWILQRRGTAPRCVGAVALRSGSDARSACHVWLSKWHWTSNVVVGLALLAFGGVPYVLWGIFFRTTLGLHATWLVNSATHKWGSRRFTRVTIPPTTGGWRCSPSARAGTTTTTRIRPARATAWPGTSSTSTGSASARSQSLGLAWDIKRARLRQALEEDRSGEAVA